MQVRMAPCLKLARTSWKSTRVAGGSVEGVGNCAPAAALAAACSTYPASAKLQCSYLAPAAVHYALPPFVVMPGEQSGRVLHAGGWQAGLRRPGGAVGGPGRDERRGAVQPDPQVPGRRLLLRPRLGHLLQALPAAVWPRPAHLFWADLLIWPPHLLRHPRHPGLRAMFPLHQVCSSCCSLQQVHEVAPASYFEPAA